jgi:hypothetical protein
MAYKKLKFIGKLEGFVPHLWDEPTYKNEPCDWRIRVRVQDPEGELQDTLTKEYEASCNYYKKQTGGKRFFDEPWDINEEDSTITVRLCAKPRYEEHPFPIVDGDLEALDKEIMLREGTTVQVSTVMMPYSLKSPKGGMRLRPRAMQVIEAVTYEASDSGELNLEEEFGKNDGFKASKPNVKKKVSKKSVTVADEDLDF